MTRIIFTRLFHHSDFSQVVNDDLAKSIDQVQMYMFEGHCKADLKTVYDAILSTICTDWIDEVSGLVIYYNSDVNSNSKGFRNFINHLEYISKVCKITITLMYQEIHEYEGDVIASKCEITYYC